MIVFRDFLKFLIKLGSRLFYCNLGPGPLVGQALHGPNEMGGPGAPGLAVGGRCPMGPIGLEAPGP